MHVHYNKQEYYDFASEFLQLSLSDEEKKQTRFSPTELTFELENVVLARLLQRINDKRPPVILPSLKAGRWLLAAATLQQLEQVLARVGHLIVPTYAVIGPPGHKLFSYQKTNNRLQQLGEQLYPAGYYVLQYRNKDKERIFERLDLWMRLEEESQKPRQVTIHPTYGTLYEYFRSALTASHWEKAEQIRQQITKSNLTSTDNLLFLEIELYAQQGRWKEISKHKDFSLFSRMQIPRAVRAALLTAFHQTYLLKYEQQNEWQQAFISFCENQPQLGQLLTARLGLKQDPVLQIYAYQAAFEHNRTTLIELKKETESLEVQTCIDQLLLLPGMEDTINAPEESTNKAFNALFRHDYDLALQYAVEIPEDVEKTGLLLQVAYHTSDTKAAEQALLCYWKLQPEQLDDLQQRFPSMEKLLDRLHQLLNIDDRNQKRFVIEDWLEWFEHVQEEPDDPELIYSIDRLASISDDRYWTAERILQLDKELLQVTLNQQKIVRLRHVRDALQKLVQFFVSEDTFPRTDSTYQQLYETLYVALLENRAKDELYTGFILLRLAEAQLRKAPSKCSSILHNLKEWSGEDHIIPTLEAWVLEVFELLIDYGLQPGLLISWYETWVSSLLSGRIQHERSNLEGWRLVGSIIQPSQHLIQGLDKVLSETLQQEVKNPIEELPSKYRIAIYTLQKEAAERARKLLLARNAELDIRICTDEVPSKSAKINAQNADLVVLVTTAMKHSLSYGISPFLEAERVVYPESSGSTSILRSIEEFARHGSDE